mmetsp:Transcript_37764/g.88701  ORF Transcript_37764/g.88701 Transcript_37764/m.88701 type:complete len:146 (-) Transcript_37764:533-970(-)
MSEGLSAPESATGGEITPPPEETGTGLERAGGVHWCKRTRPAVLMHPFPWALGKRKRVPRAAHGLQHTQRACEEPETSSSSCAAQSLQISWQCLQAQLFIKRRSYMVTQDPRLLITAKALESELRRRVQVSQHFIANLFEMIKLI